MKCQYWKVELIALPYCTIVRENVIGVHLIFVLKTQASSRVDVGATNHLAFFYTDGTERSMFALDLI